MDNGQYSHNTDNLFAEGITESVGKQSEDTLLSTQDDLNANTFMASHDYNKIGSQALTNPVNPDADFELDMPPDASNQVLGQVVDLPTPGRLNKASDSVVPTEEKETSIDPTIAKHLADGKVNNDDVGYLKGKVDELVNDPIKLTEFIMSARRTIAKGDTGEAQ